MSFVFNEAKRLIAAGGFNWASDTFRVMLVMTNTTADTEDDTNTLTGFSVLDEYDGAGYSRATVSGKVVVEDSPNNRAECDCSDFAFGAAAAGTRLAQGMVLYKFVTSDADSIPIAYIDSAEFPFAGNGSTITVTVNAQGLLAVS